MSSESCENCFDEFPSCVSNLGIESDVEGSCNLKHIRETYSKLIASEFEKLKKLYDGRESHEASSHAKHHSGVKKHEACDKDLIDTTEG